MEDATRPDEVTRWVEGADGQVAVQTGKSGGQVLQLVDLHGDVVGQVPIGEGADKPPWQELRYSAFDEFGNPQAPMIGDAPSDQTFSNGKRSRSSAQSFVYHYAKHGAKYKSPNGYAKAAAARLKDVAGSQSRSVRRSPGGKLNPSRGKWDTFW